MSREHRETPVKRVYANGRVRWLARYTDSDGKRCSAGTYDLKKDAQNAIDMAYGRPVKRDTVGAYFDTWMSRYPRSKRTNDTNEYRIGRVIDVKVEGRALREWAFIELRRKHALELVDHMLRVQGRATTGVVGILRSLSAMAEDAITDEIAELNAFKGVKVRANDPRARKQPRPIRVWSWDEMHAFAAAAGRVRTTKTVDRKGRKLPDRGPSPIDRWRPVYAEAMIRVVCDAGVRLGELLPLEREDLDEGIFTISRTSHEGETQGGSKREHLEGLNTGGRSAPSAPTVVRLIGGIPPRIDTKLMFPTSTGKLWRERNFYRDVWYPAQRECGMDIRPHEMRHSWVTHLRAAGIDDADLADMAGHQLATMLGRYTHPLRSSYDQVRILIG